MLKFRTIKESIILANMILLASMMLFILGIFNPFITITTFYFFDEQQSIISSIALMFERSEWLLFFALGLFTIIFPIIKIIILFFSLNIKHLSEKSSHMLMHAGKWSMLDVFIVAILLVVFKLDAIVSAQVHIGLYQFMGSIILMQIAALFAHNQSTK